MKCHLLPLLDGDAASHHLLIGTDSVTAAALHRKGYSARSYDLNCVADTDREMFPNLRCTYKHIAGVKNVIADALSRGKTLTDKMFGKLEIVTTIKESLQRLLGVFLPGGSTSVGGGNATDLSPSI
jgi:hypothetical protein